MFKRILVQQNFRFNYIFRYFSKTVQVIISFLKRMIVNSKY